MSGDSFSRIMELGSSDDAEIAPVASGGDAFSRISGTAEPLRQPASFGIDFDQPKAVVRKQIAKLPAADRKAAMRQWADVFVQKERAADKGSLSRGASDVVRNLTRGTVVGSWLDEANAATASAQNALGLGGAPYDEALAYQRATNRAVDSESTVLGKLPIVGDVTAGGVTKLAGGILSAPVTGAVQVARGATMLPRIANAAATGGLYGLIYGAGEGEDVSTRAMNATKGAGMGVALGGAMPAVASGLARAATAASRAVSRGTPQALRQFHPKAVENVQRAFIDDINAPNRADMGVRGYAVRAGQLGPDGALADMGPNLSAQAGAIASMPGRGKSLISNMLRNRAGGSRHRIAQATDAALGQPVNPAAAERAATRAANENAAPLYDQFYQTTVPINRELRALLQRAEAIGADRRAAQLLQAEGIDPATVTNNGRFFDLIKRAVDDMVGTAQRQGERNLVRIYSDISRGLRNEVDTALSPRDPAQSVWAQARRTSGDGLQYRQGLEDGQRAFSRNVSPDQMATDMNASSAIQRQGYVEGARDQIRQAMGNASTKFGENASAKGRALLGSGNARRKVNMLANDPANARRLVRQLDREADFDRTYTSVLQNSQTASRQAAQREFPSPTDGSGAANELGKKSISGLTMEGAYRVLNGLLNGALNERRVSIARDAADLLIAQGGRRDQIAAALLSSARRAGVTAQRRQAIENLAEHVIGGARQQAIVTFSEGE